MTSDAPTFDEDFRFELKELLRWRRDVRHFKSDPVPRDILMECLRRAAEGPSVGNSQPWRFVLVDAPVRRQALYDLFREANADALAAYDADRAENYARLKLQGLRDAPVQLSVFADVETDVGHGLGSRTMPEAKAYSVVSAIQILWLMLRAHGIGLGWLSILPPEKMAGALDMPAHLKFIGHLCIGYPAEDHDTPELVREGWQDRLPLADCLFQR
jgi:5,6-dimethylbenzimidazole synthase